MHEDESNSKRQVKFQEFNLEETEGEPDKEGAL
jgi:hypothetical protein